MSTNRPSVRVVQAALWAGMVVAAGSALGQQATDVVIQAARPTTVMRAGPNEVVSVTRHVSYADLDLATQKGDWELEKRVNDAAKEVCKRLDKVQPAQRPSDLNCVKETVAKAMEQVHIVVSAASNAAAGR